MRTSFGDVVVVELVGLVLLAAVAFVVWRLYIRPQTRERRDRAGELTAVAPAVGLVEQHNGSALAKDPSFPFEYEQPHVLHVMRPTAAGRLELVFDVRYEMGTEPPVVIQQTLAAFRQTTQGRHLRHPAERWSRR